jgi:hypothetical protein
MFLNQPCPVSSVVQLKLPREQLISSSSATELADSSVNLTVFFWVESQQANAFKGRDQIVTGIELAWTKQVSTCHFRILWFYRRVSLMAQTFYPDQRQHQKQLLIGMDTKHDQKLDKTDGATR